MPIDDPHYALTTRLKWTGAASIMQWHETNEGHHLILAGNDEQLARVFKVVLKDNPWARPVRQWRGTIVRPPKWMRSAYRLQKYQEDIRSFACSATRLVQEYVEDHDGEWPAKYRACDKYLPPSPDYFEESSQEEIEEFTEDHLQCLLCDGGKVVPRQGSWATAMEEALAEGKLPPHHYLTCLKAKLPEPLPDGVEASEEGPLFYSEHDGWEGHHESRLSRLTPDDCSIYHDVAFFFQGQEVSVNFEATQAAQVAAATLKAQVEERDREIDAERREANAAHRRARKDFLGD